MATVAHADSKRMYSWWWDSHISPKNSKWLQENLTGMDAKVKQMIKLIEEDADSFARRAEMYYKKRPELMKLVEEFYRAYRALAERYDHATGVLRQAHRTMAEAFPNQIPMVLVDDSPAATSMESEPHTPDMPPPVRALLDPEEFQKDASGLSPSHFHAVKRNGAFTEESDSVTGRKGLKQLNDLFGSGEVASHAKFAEGRARKGLNFHDTEEKERSLQNDGSNDLKARIPSESERVAKAELEIVTLKNALAKLEAEKESSQLQYEKSLERLSKLESEVSRAQGDSIGLNERASIAETEVQTLKEALSKLEVEREASLLQYQQCLDKIANLENNMSHVQQDAGALNERASKAEIEAQSLKQNLTRVEAEKEAAMVQYKNCLEMISSLEEKLLHAEEDARRISERANKAESEVEALKPALTKLTEDKEAAALQYLQCLERISSLEHKLASAEEEVQRLNGEIDNGVAKLKGAEERCLLLERSNQTMHSELESLMQKMGAQSQELTEKQKELGRLWTCIQEERLRFVEAETAFQTLQHLHSQSQDELRALAAELQNRGQILKDMETHNKDLQDEVHKVKEENRGMNELNLSSAVSIQKLQDEISALSDTIGKLEVEVELRVDQRNALQQEIYCLKEELNDLNKNHQAMVMQVKSVGLSPECFGSSVKELKDEKIRLIEIYETERSEKVAVLEKLEIMERLVDKNALLENSLSDLNVELEGVRGKVKELEELCRSLLGEKSTLVSENATIVSQLLIARENLEKLSEKNNFVENCLFDANDVLEGLREKLKSLEDSYLLLDDEKSGLITERECLISQLDVTRNKMEILEKYYMELEEKYSCLEREREFTLHKMEELQVSLDVEREEHAGFVQLSESQLAAMASQIRLLQGEGLCRKKEYEEELDKALNAQIEICILQKCLKDLEEQNCSLLAEYRKLVEATKLSEKLISELKDENYEKQGEVKSLFDQIKVLRMGIYQVLGALDINADCWCEDKIEQDQSLLKHVLSKLQESQNLIFKMEDENQRLVVENSVVVMLLDQLQLEAENLETQKNTLNQELSIQSEQFSVLQGETHKLMEMNEEFRLKIMKGEDKEEVLKIEIENLHGQLLELRGAYQNLQEENRKVLDERKSLMKSVLDLVEEKRNLEEENSSIFAESISQSTLSLIFEDIMSGQYVQIKMLSENLGELQCLNDDLDEKIRIMEGKLEDLQMENLRLNKSLEKSENKLVSVRSISDQLNCEIEGHKGLLHQKENDFLKAQEMLYVMQNEKIDLQKVVEDLKCKYDEVKVIQEDQEKQIIKLSGDCDHQCEETERICNTNQEMEARLLKLCEELEEIKRREESLCHHLQQGRNDIELWESEAAAFFGELQISAVWGALFEEKIHEVTEACGNLEDKNYSKEMEIHRLKERISNLEGENSGLKAQLAAYPPAVISLRDCIKSLENHTLSPAKLHKVDGEQAKDTEWMDLQHVEICQQTSDDQVALQLDGFSDLQELQMRIKAVEKGVMEKEGLALLENLNANARLEAAMRQIEELKSGSSLHQEGVPANKHVNPKPEEDELGDRFVNNLRLRKPTPEISEVGNEVMTKDIMLDQVSECSSYGISRRETVEVDDRMLEMWETSDQGSSINLKVGKAQKAAAAPPDYHQIDAVKKRHKEHPSTDSLFEKELGVDKLEISKRFSGSRQEGNGRKILERLDSDAQKLANLQITVQDLKRKVEISEKSKKGKGIEYYTVREQLEESEEAITKLFDVNRRLMQNVQEGSSSFDEKSAVESGESGSINRRKISEQARRGSEKIGRLQLEVQKLQFLLLKLDEEKEGRGKIRITERKTRVLLRDYLYGGGRTNHKRKKTPFCACMQPPTKGD